MSPGADARPPVDHEIIQRITEALSGLRHGSVQIIVQDCKVVQIDRTQKFRVPAEVPRKSR